METRVPLKFAGRQERAGGSFPPSRLEREEEAGEVPPTPGEREGRRKKGKGEEKRAGPGNHLRLPRPRGAPGARGELAAPRLGAPCWGGRAATFGGSLVAAPRPRAAHRRLAPLLARPLAPRSQRGEGWGAAEAGGRPREAGWAAHLRSCADG